MRDNDLEIKSERPLARPLQKSSQIFGKVGLTFLLIWFTAFSVFMAGKNVTWWFPVITLV